MDHSDLNLLTGSSLVDFLNTENGMGEDEAKFSIAEQRVQQDKILGGSSGTTENKSLSISITGKELPGDWPRIATPAEERKGYEALYDPGEDKGHPPQHEHIHKLSYTLKNGQKEYRTLAVQHVAGLENKNHPQFAALKANFDSFRPQIVLYEGPVSNPPTMTEEQAYTFGDQAYTQYLVLEQNKTLQDGEQPIVMDSWDLQDKDFPEEYRKRGYSNEEIAANEVFKWVFAEAEHIRNTPGLSDEERKQRLQDLQSQFDANPASRVNPDFLTLIPRDDGQEWTHELVRTAVQNVSGHSIDVNLRHADAPKLQQMFDDGRQIRDEYAIKEKAEALKKYDRVLVVEGSGHSIRQKQALSEFMGTGDSATNNDDSRMQEIKSELTSISSS